MCLIENTCDSEKWTGKPALSRAGLSDLLATEFEGILVKIEDTANMLRGMTLDPRIPNDTKECMRDKIVILEEIIEKHCG